MKLADCHRALADIYIKNNYYLEAEGHLLKWYELGLQCKGNKNTLSTEYYFRVAQYYQFQQRYQYAIDYYKIALSYIENQNYAQKIHIFIYECYLFLKDPFNANVYLQEIRYFIKESKIKFSKSKARNNLMIIGQEMIGDQNYDKVNRLSNKRTSICLVKSSDGGFDSNKYIVKSEIFNSGSLSRAWTEFTSMMKFSKKGSQFPQVYGMACNKTIHGYKFDIMMEKCEENLLEYASKKRITYDFQLLNMLNDLIHGFLIMKQSRFAHGDIKPENILITGEGKAKIADFGSILRLDEIDKVIAVEPKSGTVAYMSPELFVFNGLRKSEYLYCDYCKSDVFSLGLSLLKINQVDITGLNDFLRFCEDDEDRTLVLEVNKHGYGELDKMGTAHKERYFSILETLQIEVDRALEKNFEWEAIKSIMKTMLIVDYKKRYNFDKLAIEIQILIKEFIGRNRSI